MKSQREIEEKLQTLKKGRGNVHENIKERGLPTTVPDWTVMLIQQLDEFKSSSQIEIVEWILKDHPF